MTLLFRCAINICYNNYWLGTQRKDWREYLINENDLILPTTEEMLIHEIDEGFEDGFFNELPEAQDFLPYSCESGEVKMIGSIVEEKEVTNS